MASTLTAEVMMAKQHSTWQLALDTPTALNRYLIMMLIQTLLTILRTFLSLQVGFAICIILTLFGHLSSAIMHHSIITEYDSILKLLFTILITMAKVKQCWLTDMMIKSAKRFKLTKLKVFSHLHSFMKTVLYYNCTW